MDATTLAPNTLSESIAVIASLEAKVVARDERISMLEEALRLLRAEKFGQKSEKDRVLHGQGLLFEPEEGEAQRPPLPTDDLLVTPHKRKKPGRKPLPDSLPRVEVIHDVPEADQICACGEQMEEFGRETTEQLERVPEKLRVIRHIRPKYSCPQCVGGNERESGVTIAPPVPQIIPKSFATPSLLAHILNAKFVDALPFYRQEKQFKRLGIDLPRATMCNWAAKIAELCAPMVELLRKELLSGPLIQMDETTLQVLKEPGRSNKKKSYMWVARGGPPGSPIILFNYQETRSSDFPQMFLDGYQGFVQTDDYSSYHFLDKCPDIIHQGCMAHVRRKFVDVVKSRGQKKGGKRGLADEALAFFRELYGLEKTMREKGLTVEQVGQRRLEEAVPMLESFKKWLDAHVDRVPPTRLLGKAINHALSNWEKLKRYTLEGYLHIDNNQAENAIRPFVVGRKNWLFSGSPGGAAASGIMFSLVETARGNGWEPYAYLNFLLENLAAANGNVANVDLQSLLPTNPPTAQPY